MTATIPNPCGASWAADYGPLPCDRPHGHDGMHRTYGSQGPIEWSTPVLPASAPAATPLMDSLRECDEKAKDLPTWATDINAAHAAQYGRPAATAGTDFPRRNQMLQWTTGERAIYDAVQVVERMGADVRLTDAVILLGKARDRVADFVEGVAPESTAHAPFAMPERSKEWWLERVDREGEYAVGAGAAAPTGEEAETGHFDKLLAAWQEAVAHNARIQGKDDVSAYHEDDPVDEETPRRALLAYLHDIETRCDPAGEVQRIASLEEQVRGLTAQATELAALRARDAAWQDFASEVGEALGCLFSTFPDGNAHIVRKARAALAPRQTTEGQP